MARIVTAGVAVVDFVFFLDEMPRLAEKYRARDAQITGGGGAANAAAAIARLVARGEGERVLLSHDVFLKSMWTRNGGNGFGYVPRLFLDRLVRHGVDPQVAAGMLDERPAAVFEAAAAHL